MIKKAVLLKLYGYIKDSNGKIALSWVASAVAAAIGIFIPYLVGKSIDLIVEPGQVDMESLIRNLILMIALIIVSSLFQLAMNRLNYMITYDTIYKIRNDAYGKIRKLPVSYIDKTSAGGIQSMIISDLETAGDGLLLFMNQFINGVVSIILTLVIMIMIDLRIALFVFIFTPVSFLVSYFIASRSFSSFKKQSTIRSKQTSYISEMTHNFRLIHVFHTQNLICEGFDKINEDYRKTSTKATFLSSITNPSSRFVNSLIYAGVALIGSLRVVGAFLTVGSLTSLFSYASQFMKPFNDLSSVYTELSDAFACLDRVFRFLSEDEMSEDLTKDLGAPWKKDEELEIEFLDVSFSYNKKDPVLEHISFKIPSGCSCAIVGPTGCGKTTLINLLMRFYEPDDGQILINGKDIKDIPRNSLRRYIGVVTQDTWFRNGPIMDNIKFGKPDLSDEEAVAVSKRSGADSFIRKLPGRYDERIDSARDDISEGQRQLLGITRAMASDRAILILDEATSSVDILTEVKIQRAVKELLEDRTSLIIAHRLSTIRDADMIVVMERGKISEIGDHRQLLKKKGFYSKLYEAGMGGTDES
ncbi:MAG: ABC transporter ATP-binding protein [Clostridiales bacterium]|nr:ABC transporter ATP-binding protein [Clostridiales bacterium]